MPSSRTLTTLLVVLLGAAAPGAMVAAATVDAVLEPQLATGAVVRVTLDGVPATVEDVGPAQPPALVVVAVDAGWTRAGADPAPVMADQVVDALRPAGSAVLVAEVTDRLALRVAPSPPSQELTEELAAVLGEVRPAPLHGDGAAALVAAVEELRAAGGTATATVAVEALRRRVEAHAASSRLAVLRRVATLEALVRRLAAVPGRKAVLLIAGELEAAPGAAVSAAWRDAFPEMPSRTLETLVASRDAEAALAALEGLAAAYRVAFYPLAGSGTLGAHLAAATGGRVVDRAAIGGVVEPARPVRVALGAPGGPAPHGLAAGRSDAGMIRVPRVWTPIGPLNAAADRTLGAVELGLAENPLEVEASPQPPRMRDDGGLTVPILVTVPVSRLRLESDGGLHRGRVSVHTAVAGTAEVGRREFPFEVPSDALEQAMASRAGFVVGVAVEPGRRLVAIGLCDLHSSSWATVLVPISVAAAVDAP